MPQHFTSPDFWRLYNALPQEVRELADKNYELLKTDSEHPSLHFKKVSGRWSVRIGDHYRALALQREEGFVWSWIGTHAEYDALLRRL